LGLSFSSHRLLKIKLFKPENSKNQAFQARPNVFWKTSFSNGNPPFETLLAEGSQLVLIFTTKMIFVKALK
jgi:hypothetical protein